MFSNRCPACGQGAIFKGLLRMHSCCPNCGQRYEKEPGFFLGASVAAYFLGTFSIVPTMIICFMILKMDIFPVLAIGTTQILLLTPLLYRFSRLLWLHTEHKMTRRLGDRK